MTPPILTQRNYLSEDYVDRFLQACRNVIRSGYVKTVEERCKSGGAVSALLSTATLVLIDTADKNNAKYVKEPVCSVGISYSAVQGLGFSISPPNPSVHGQSLPEATYR